MNKYSDGSEMRITRDYEWPRCVKCGRQMLPLGLGKYSCVCSPDWVYDENTRVRSQIPSTQVDTIEMSSTAQRVMYRDLVNPGLVAVRNRLYPNAPFAQGEIKELTRKLKKYALVVDSDHFFIYGE